MVFSKCSYILHLQRGEAKLLTEDWEGAVEDLKSAAQRSPQVSLNFYIFKVLVFPEHCCQLLEFSLSVIC